LVVSVEWWFPPSQVALGEQEPCLLIRRRTWHGSRVVTAARLFYPGSRYQLFGRF
ncbi:UTRA domain-containing protein, partial [Dickeya dianthicola]|uniref:UTRA domain-containing protein n=1 Tax=Dickeya dianthicola TaxID=204039 RepID=UPI002FCCC603